MLRGESDYFVLALISQNDAIVNIGAEFENYLKFWVSVNYPDFLFLHTFSGYPRHKLFIKNINNFRMKILRYGHMYNQTIKPELRQVPI